MGYSPHYLMFACRPRLLVDIYFPTFRSTEVPMRGASAKHMDEYMANFCDWLRATVCEAQAQSMAEAQQQKQYYNWKIGTMDLKSGDLVLVKADAYQGKRKIKDKWEDKPHVVVCQIVTDVPSYEVTDQHRQSHILHYKWLLVTSETGIPCVWVSVKHRTEVPAQPQLSPHLRGVTVRLHHKKIVVWQSPSIRPGRLPRGGSMGSYDFSCEHLPEHPPRMDGDFR